ncbi:hypothetical protein [Rhizobium sp. BK251]|uniref:hypothetical protein n=1 Tax=Rhizobium sp. BK251 TaxID=2512125 RepID=UPI0010439C15|nr:hypothetical protein [Rhizobium sp. BK251]TCL73628.1 hypothetical protein EV286_103159 [Rhizobium sp. BK251]
MSDYRLAFPACVIAGKNRLEAEDVTLLRSSTFPAGIRSAEDVIVLLTLQNCCPEKSPEWDSFFIEALTAFIVNHSYPQGTLDEINVAWLRRIFAAEGVVQSTVELELLLHVVEVSAHVPDTLTSLLLDQLRLAITDEIGAYHLSRMHARKGVTRQDTEFVHRVLRRKLEKGRFLLSAAEIAVLRRVDGGIDPLFNHPRWSELMNAVDMREDEDRPPRQSRWLRVSDDMLASDTSAA